MFVANQFVSRWKMKWRESFCEQLDAEIKEK